MHNEVETGQQYLHDEAPQEEQKPQEQAQPPQESQKEHNFRIMRDRAESAERRAQELERMVQMNMNQNQQSNKINLVEDEDDFDLSDDTYIEGKHLKKYVKNLKQELKSTKKQFEEFNQRNSLAQAEMRLKTEFNDFDIVVSKDNLERLASLKPALYRSIMSNQDIYDKGYTAYELIKNSGVIANSYADSDRRIEENRNKPRSAANVGAQVSEAALSRVGDYDRRELTEERKEQLRRQVEQAKKYR